MIILTLCFCFKFSYNYIAEVQSLKHLHLMASFWCGRVALFEGSQVAEQEAIVAMLSLAGRHRLTYTWIEDGTSWLHTSAVLNSANCIESCTPVCNLIWTPQHYQLLQIVYRIKGKFVLRILPSFDVVKGVSVDYVHCVLLGLVRKLLNLWFDNLETARMVCTLHVHAWCLVIILSDDIIHVSHGSMHVAHVLHMHVIDYD